MMPFGGWRFFLVALFLVGVGCKAPLKRHVQRSQVPSVVVDVPRLERVEQASGSGVRKATKNSLIEPGRVGPFAVAKPLDTAHFPSDLAKYYHTEMFADAQPLEGFVSRNPPVLVLVEGGPFKRFGYNNPGKAVPASVVAQAVQAARQGRLRMRMLVITSPELRTSKGIGVGSRFHELKAAYPNAEVAILPGLWEEPSCIVELPGRLPVGFFFKRCRGTNEGVHVGADESVIRVVLRTAR